MGATTRVRLADRLPRDDPAFTAYVETSASVDHRRALRGLAKNTARVYRTRWRHYQTWCSQVAQRQPGVDFVDEDAVEQYVLYQTRVELYAPKTIGLSINAIAHYLERAGRPVPAFSAARGGTGRLAAVPDPRGPL